jgi:hypothetical protein
VTNASTTLLPKRVIAIGGAGGSGTRVVAQTLRDLGFAFAPDLNDAYDNLWFTLLFKYREAYGLPREELTRLYTLFRSAMEGEGARVDQSTRHKLLAAQRAGQHRREWLEARLATLVVPAPLVQSGKWGWKEPNTHIFANHLLTLDHDLAYVHVMRDGLDMAFGTNQNQLHLWGPIVLGSDYEDSPRGSLRYWMWAHSRMAEIARQNPGRVFILSFEALCRDPREMIGRLASFAGLQLSHEAVADLVAAVVPPSTIGRSRVRESEFDAQEVASSRRVYDTLLQFR